MPRARSHLVLAGRFSAAAQRLSALAPACSQGGVEAGQRVEDCEADLRDQSLRLQLERLGTARPGLIPDTPGLLSQF